MKLVILESPFAGAVDANLSYGRRCMRDCLERGEAPFASHLLYTQPGVLDDTKPVERKLGIEAGLLWGTMADATVVYIDRGVSRGMVQGICAAFAMREIHFRTILLPIELQAGLDVFTKTVMGEMDRLLTDVGLTAAMPAFKAAMEGMAHEINQRVGRRET